MTHCCEQKEGTAAPEAGEHKCKHHAERKYTNFVAVLLAIAAVILVYNQYQISAIGGGSEVTLTGAAVLNAGANVASVSPTGMPVVYGKELSVKYDDVSTSNPTLADKTITKLSNLDRTLTLAGADKTRYIKIVSQISCEYCCSAESIIFPTGEPACGCAHSFAMRGLAKYLVTKHPDMKDDAILEELGKWKTLFFPEIMAQKAAVLKQKNIPFNYVNLASNKYRDIEKGASGGSMVGGC